MSYIALVFASGVAIFLSGYLVGTWISAARERNRLYEFIDEIEKVRDER